MAAVPVAALTENFSSRPLIAPPPVGTETDGRKSAARASLSVPAEAALSEVPARGLTGPAEWPEAPAGPVVPEEVPASSGGRLLSGVIRSGLCSGHCRLSQEPDHDDRTTLVAPART